MAEMSSGQSVENDAPLDLDAIKDKWLLMCGPCDGGLPMGCTHPDEDYRPVMLALVREIEHLRAGPTPLTATEEAR